MVSLETLALANNPQDAGQMSPPKCHQKFTILYAHAAKSGILKKSDSAGMLNEEKNMAGTVVTPNTNTEDSESATSHQVSWDESKINASKLTGSSLSRLLTNSKMQLMQKDLDSELKDLKNQPRK
jgi:hypothetical protein